MDRVDWVATIGFLGIVAATWLFALDALASAAILGGFVLSISLRRFYDGAAWEALGWLAWVLAAVILAFGIDGKPALLGAFLATIVLGAFLQYGGRFGFLPDIWTEDRPD